MKSKKVIKMPWLYNAGGDVTKQWYIRYSIVNPFTGKTEHIKISKGANKSKCVIERTAAARKEMYKLTRKLKAGWTKYDDDLYQQVESIEKRKGTASVQIIEETLTKLIYKTLPQTQRFYKLFLKYFLDFIKEKRCHNYLHQITETVAESFDTWLLETKSAKTRNEAIATIKRVFAELARTKKIESNPFQFFKKKSPRSKPFKFYTPDITQKVNKAAADQDPQLLIYLQVIYYCTIRCNEARHLQVHNINLEQATLTINIQSAKLAKQRAVAMPEQLVKLFTKMKLSQYPSNYYIFSASGKPDSKITGKNYFVKRFRKLRDNNAIDADYKSYGLKHTGGIRLLQSGVAEKDIQRHMGHTTPSTTQVYLSQYVAPPNKKIKHKYPDFSAGQ